MALAFCAGCGSVLPEKARFCPFCGLHSVAGLEKDESSEKLFFLLSGIVVGVPVALFFESVFHLWFTTLGLVTVVAPLVEEFAKADPLFYRRERSGKSLMTLGALSGLGFGVAEFFAYVYKGVPVLFRLPAVAFHAAGTSIVAYGVYRRETLKYYLLAVVLHVVNNFFAGLGSLWLFGGLGATLASYYFAWTFYKRVQKNAL